MDGESRRIIAVCASWEDEENLNLILGQMIRETEGQGFLPLFIPFVRNSIDSRGAESLREFVSVFDVPNLAGIMLLGEMIRSDVINGALIRFAQEKKVPVFMLERRYEGCINLEFSYLAGFEKVARHIVEDHGCRNVVMIAGIRGNSYSEERISLCRRILEENGGTLPPGNVIYGEYWDEPTIRELDRYFAAGGQMPEAFICANDAMAITVSIYLAERNVRVPEQVRVAGFDGVGPGEKHEPAITTAKPDFPAMYGQMLEKMRSWRPEETGNTEEWPVPYELIRRGSCGCVERDSFGTIRKMGELKLENLSFTRHIRGMGNFIQRTLSVNSLEKLADCLRPIFSIRYNFAAVLDEEDREIARPLLHRVNGQFVEGGAFRRREQPVPDFETLCADPSIRIVMTQLLQNEEETMGYLVAGLESWCLRDQERFEEQALFLSAALNAVIGNRRLKEANNAILRMAEHDYLTGLYNRRGFLRELERRLQMRETQGMTLTLFAMDMDRLKNVNDIYGHHEGDTAIQCLAYALQQETEGKGICARYGGDEFAFALLSDSSFLPEMEQIRARIEKTAREKCGSKDYTICASLGACACAVRERPSLDQLLAEADRALYADKSRRRARGTACPDTRTP